MGKKLGEELAEPNVDRDTVLTVGVFDGVHRGYQHLVPNLVQSAENHGMHPGVVTFRSHPASILRPDFKPRYLTILDQRTRLLNSLGVDFVVPITFDMEVSGLGSLSGCCRISSG